MGVWLHGKQKESHLFVGGRVDKSSEAVATWTMSIPAAVRPQERHKLAAHMDLALEKDLRTSPTEPLWCCSH